MIIGYTAGVFDLFHVGHLNILKKAKEQCDHLIVAVSTDELVREYKRKAPVICFEERMEKYHFNKMFVGDDWKGSPLFNEVEKKFRAVGVEVVYFPYTKGTSSTILKETLSKINESISSR